MLRFDRLLVPVDFSKYSMAALEYALALAKKLNGPQTLVVLHVAEGLPHFLESSSKGTQPGKEHEKEMKRVAKEEIKRFIKKVDAGEEKIDFAVIVGKPAAEKIAQYADDKGFDAIVIGSQGKGALERLVLGSCMLQVQRLANCPVLAVKHPSEWVSKD
ncbi:MAG: universal stress protein [Proteobacteria bacterium]|jgi:nucleotide-binding universal stress UspA family protein|nr:universal stress protein [Pseudomonadota bacterium]